MMLQVCVCVWGGGGGGGGGGAAWVHITTGLQYVKKNAEHCDAWNVFSVKMGNGIFRY